MSLTCREDDSSEWGFKVKCQSEGLDINWHSFSSQAKDGLKLSSKCHVCFFPPPGASGASSFFCSGFRRWQPQLALRNAEQAPTGMSMTWSSPGWKQIKAPDREWTPNPLGSSGFILRLWVSVKNVWQILSNCPRKRAHLFTLGKGGRNLPSSFYHQDWLNAL